MTLKRELCPFLGHVFLQHLLLSSQLGRLGERGCREICPLMPNIYFYRVGFVSTPQLNLHLKVWRLNDLSIQQCEMKSHTLDSFIQGFVKISSIIYLNDSDSFKVKTCHDQRHLKGNLTGKNKLWIQNSESKLNIAFRIVFKNKLSLGSSAQVTEKQSRFFSPFHHDFVTKAIVPWGPLFFSC